MSRRLTGNICQKSTSYGDISRRETADGNWQTRNISNDQSAFGEKRGLQIEQGSGACARPAIPIQRHGRRQPSRKLNYAEFSKLEVGDGKAQVTRKTLDLIIIVPAIPTQFAFERTGRSVQRQLWSADRQYSIPLSNSADLPVS